MNRPLVLILTAAALLLAPLSAAQAAPGNWNVMTDARTYFIGDRMALTIYGPNNTYYVVDIVDAGRNYTKRAFTGGDTGPLGNDTVFFKFDILMFQDYPGTYQLNVSVGGVNVTGCVIELVYDYGFIHNQTHEEIRNEDNRQNANDAILFENDRALQNQADTLKGLVFLMGVSIIILFDFILFPVIIPVLTASNTQSKRSTKWLDRIRGALYGSSTSAWHFTNVSNEQSERARQDWALARAIAASDGVWANEEITEICYSTLHKWDPANIPTGPDGKDLPMMGLGVPDPDKSLADAKKLAKLMGRDPTRFIMLARKVKQNGGSK